MRISYTSIDIERLYKQSKLKGTDRENNEYFDVVLIDTPRGKTDFMIKMNTTMEEYEAEKHLDYKDRKQLPIIGSGFYPKGHPCYVETAESAQPAAPAQQRPRENKTVDLDIDEDVPF